MPRLVHISGNRLLTLGVAQNKSVLISVGGKPFCFCCVFESVVGIIDIKRKTCLMLGISGAGGIPVRRLCTVAPYIAVIKAFLNGVASKARADPHFKVLLAFAAANILSSAALASGFTPGL